MLLLLYLEDKSMKYEIESHELTMIAETDIDMVDLGNMSDVLPSLCEAEQGKIKRLSINLGLSREGDVDRI